MTRLMGSDMGGNGINGIALASGANGLNGSNGLNGLNGREAKTLEAEEPRGVVLERVLHVNITNSLGNLALAGPQGGQWTLVDGAQHVVLGQSAGDIGASTSQLGSVLIHEVQILQQHNGFPVPLGVQFNCIPAREYTDLGEAYAYTVLPNSKLNSPETIYTAPPLNDEMYEWHKQYPQYTAANLEEEGIMQVNNQAFCFMDKEHPAVPVLRYNSHLLGCDIDSQKKVENTWFKVSRQVLKVCCDTIREKVMSKMKTYDLNTLSLQIHRINAIGWEDLGDGTVAMSNFKLKSSWTPEEEEAAKRSHLRKFTSSPYTYTARIKIRYEMPRLA